MCLQIHETKSCYLMIGSNKFKKKVKEEVKKEAIMIGQQEQEEAAPTVTREHLEVCQGYAFLRVGKDITIKKEQMQYFMAVMAMRKK